MLKKIIGWTLNVIGGVITLCIVAVAIGRKLSPSYDRACRNGNDELLGLWDNVFK